MYGTIERLSTGYRIKVDGFRPVCYLGFSRRAALQHYRRENGLARRRITWLDI